MMVGIISLIGVSLTINPTPVHAARKLQHRMQGKRLRLRPALVVAAGYVGDILHVRSMLKIAPAIFAEEMANRLDDFRRALPIDCCCDFHFCFPADWLGFA